jgi:hypothetical protein
MAQDLDDCLLVRRYHDFDQLPHCLGPSLEPQLSEARQRHGTASPTIRPCTISGAVAVCRHRHRPDAIHAGRPSVSVLDQQHKLAE